MNTKNNSNVFKQTTPAVMSRILINSTEYPLNKSNSKFVKIGLCVENDFEPCIELCGKKNQSVVLSEEDWRDFLQYQGVIANYMVSANLPQESIYLKNMTLHFENFAQLPILKITTDGGLAYLGNETVCRLWEQIPLIDYRLIILQKQKFKNYFYIFKNTLFCQADCLEKIYSTLSPKDNPNSENVCTMLELLLLYPEKLEQKLMERNFYEKGNF